MDVEVFGFFSQFIPHIFRPFLAIRQGCDRAAVEILPVSGEEQNKTEEAGSFGGAGRTLDLRPGDSPSHGLLAHLPGRAPSYLLAAALALGLRQVATRRRTSAHARSAVKAARAPLHLGGSPSSSPVADSEAGLHPLQLRWHTSAFANRLLALLGEGWENSAKPCKLPPINAS